MTKITITGNTGLIGSHAEIYFSGQDGYSTCGVGREIYSDTAQMDECLSVCDILLHFAARVRGSDEEILNENREITTQLISGLERTGARPHIFFSSSINKDRDDAHGQSKREADHSIKIWCQENSTPYTCLILPHIFGEGGRPQHNSVISTFCAMVARKEQPTIDADGIIEPLHAQRALDSIHAAITDENTPDVLQIPGNKMHVSEMLGKLTILAQTYQSQIIPDLRDDFDLDLFNTYRSYLFPAYYPAGLQRHTDPRGSLVELVRELNGGQAFYSVTKPGITRGNHFHRRKVERFLVISGKANISLRRMNEQEPISFEVDGADTCYIDIPTLYTHNITNIGDTELVTLFWVHELFDPENPDTYAETV